MNDFEKTLIQNLRNQDFDFDDNVIFKFCEYAKLLVEWNKKINLTTIINPEEIAIKHFYDSVVLLKSIEIKQGAKVIDVGTGAGFPGIPLKIVRPDIDLTLMDSLNKRLIFLDEVVKKINLSASLVHARAEEFGRKGEYREKFDFSVSRAVAKLNVLSELCLPFVKKNGFFIALKSQNIEKEIFNSISAIEKLGGNLEKIDTITLFEETQRSIVKIKKIKETPSIYPRQGVKISKKPL